jgi:hypothetical protein
MKIRDLSPEQLEKLFAICAEAELKCEGILGIEIEDLPHPGCSGGSGRAHRACAQVV